MLHSKATQYNSTSKRWDFNAEYEYTVEGKTYRNYIATFYTITHQEEAESLARDFPLDKEIRVFYNPSNPKQSVLKRGNTNRSKNGEVIFASLGVIFGIGIMIAGYLDVFSN